MAEHQIYAVAARQHGVFAVRQAIETGLSERAVRRRVDEGVFKRIHRSVLGVPGWPAGPRRMLWIGTLAVSGSAVARWSAAALYRMPVPAAPTLPAIVVPKGKTHIIDGLRLHETRMLCPSDTRTVEGLPVTSPARTLIDLAAELRRQRLFHVIDQSVERDHLALDELSATFSSLTKFGRPGSRLIEQYLISRLGTSPVPVSELEFRFDRLIAKTDLPPSTPQYQPPWYDGIRGLVDRAWPQARLIVELDGRSFHSTMQAMTDDRRRDRLAQRHGWRVLRFTFSEVRRRPDEVVDDVRSVLGLDDRRRAA